MDVGFCEIEPLEVMLRAIDGGDGDVYFLTRNGEVRAAVVPITVYEELRLMAQRLAVLHEPVQRPEPEPAVGILVGPVLDDIRLYLTNLSGKGRWTSEDYRRVYLASPHWRERRLIALSKAGNTCEGCGATGRLDVHHLTYERMGAELDEDLEVRCRACHDAEHQESA